MTETDRKFFANLVNTLCNDYAFHRDVANKIAMKAWEDGYSKSYNEVKNHAFDIADFVERILWLEMGYAGNHCFDESKFEGTKAHKKFVESENNG